MDTDKDNLKSQNKLQILQRNKNVSVKHPKWTKQYPSVYFYPLLVLQSVLNMFQGLWIITLTSDMSPLSHSGIWTSSLEVNQFCKNVFLVLSAARGLNFCSFRGLSQLCFFSSRLNSRCQPATQGTKTHSGRLSKSNLILNQINLASRLQGRTTHRCFIVSKKTTAALWIQTWICLVLRQ